MNKNDRIIILGTSHSLQCGTNEYSVEQIEEFRLLITEICKQNNVKCLVEEMNDEGLSNHGVNNTIPSEVAKVLSIKHCYSDLTAEHLADLCIYIDMFTFREPTNELKTSKRDLLHSNLLDPIRERYWLSTILYLNRWPTLFICGSDHVESMKDLVTKLEYGPVCSLVRF